MTRSLSDLLQPHMQELRAGVHHATLKVRREELMAQHHSMQCRGSYHNAKTREAVLHHIPMPIAGMDRIEAAVSSEA